MKPARPDIVLRVNQRPCLLDPRNQPAAAFAERMPEQEKAMAIEVLQYPTVQNRQWIARLDQYGFSSLLDDPYEFVSANIHYSDSGNEVWLFRERTKQDLAIQCFYDFATPLRGISKWSAVATGVGGLNGVGVRMDQPGL